MIEFNGIDIVVLDEVDDASVRRALATTLQCPAERVSIIGDLNDYPQAGTADVVCVRTPVHGEFAGLLSVQADQLTLPYESATQLAQRLCELLGSQCLAPCDDDINPYVMCLASPASGCRNIALDPVALDEGRYVVARGIG